MTPAMKLIYPLLKSQSPNSRKASLFSETPFLFLLARSENVCEYDSFILITLSSSQGAEEHAQSSQAAASSHFLKIKCADVPDLTSEACTACCRVAARNRLSSLSAEEITGTLEKLDDGCRNSPKASMRCACCAPVIPLK
uniref:Uncharacterized protein n=1 Tax=Steinernema glaseri TaxID=37863 RepID=A0A1I8AVQ3_9BILA